MFDSTGQLANSFLQGNIRYVKRGVVLRQHLSLMWFLPFLGGCAFINLDVTPPGPNVFSDAPNLGRGREVLIDMPFADRRGFPARCGMQKNSYNMDTADVNCLVSPPQWVAQALEQGLTTAKFRVLHPGDPIGPNVVRIQGAVTQFFVEPDIGAFTVSPEADVGVKLIVTSGSGLRAERVFYVKGTDTSLMATESNFQHASDDATVQIVRLMVESLSKLMNQYPQLGQTTESGVGPVALQSPVEKPQ